MIHPHTALRFITDKIGYGVVATQLIPRGTITWVRDDFDQAFSALHIESMAPIYHALTTKYCFVDAKGDSRLWWDLARKEKSLVEAVAVLAHKIPIASCRQNYYPGIMRRPLWP